MIIAQHANFTIIATQSPSKLEAAKAAVAAEAGKEGEAAKAPAEV
jgi:formylmethanofuran:tetrahydromethanopterin formyltransferase